MNKKGFAISIILYTVVLIIITIFYIVLGIVKSRYSISNKSRNEILNTLNSVEYRYTQLDNNDAANELIVNPNGGIVLFNGGEIDSAVSVVKYANSTIELPNPTRSTQIEENVGTYTVTYNANGASNNPNNDSVSVDSISTYIFNKWDGIENCGSLSNNIYTFPNTFGTTCTKVALWDVDVSLRAKSIKLPSVQRAGYLFNGWYTASSGGNKVGNASSDYIPTSNITLHAQWELDDVLATSIKYDNKNSPNLNCNDVQCAIDEIKKVLNH